MNDSNNKSRTISTSGLTFVLQYLSKVDLMAWYNKQTFPIKKCPFCEIIELNDLAKAEVDRTLLPTNISFFDGHTLLVAPNHGNEYWGKNLSNMLSYLNRHEDEVLAYDGSKNAGFNDCHFFCHSLGSSVKLPLITDSESSFYKDIDRNDQVSVGILKDYGRGVLLLKSLSSQELLGVLDELEHRLGVNLSSNKRPYVNLILWKKDDIYNLAVIPRVVHRPAEYYDQNNEWDIAPGALEMGGLYLLNNYDEYLHLTADMLVEIGNEVSYGYEHLVDVVKNISLTTKLEQN